MKHTASERITYWQSHIAQWGAAGVSQADYCRQHHLKLHQFTYWRSKLRNNSGSDKKSRSADAAFIPVAIDVSQPSGLVVCLPNGCRVEGITSRSLGLLQPLLGMLK